MERDVPDAVYGDFAKAIDGGICPCCGKPKLKIARGIEVGNIFQLGTKMPFSSACAAAVTPPAPFV